MNVIDAASSLGVTPSTVRNQVERGVLAGEKRGREWWIDPAEVERYRRDHLGDRSRPNMSTRSPEMEDARLAALRSPLTKAKMRAAKVGRKQSPEHVQNAAATRRGRPLTEDHRERVSMALKGRPFTTSHREATTAASRTPEERARRSAIQVERYLSGRRPYSALEKKAAALLIPLGFERFRSLDGHAFDFARDDVVVEVNGCGVHRHQIEKPSCSWTPYGRRPDVNDRYREIARSHGLTLVELWACERLHWPELIAHRVTP